MADSDAIGLLGYCVVRLALAILLFSLTANGTSFYIDYSAGSDLDNGHSTSHPWKRHPYMQGFAGSYTHTAGDRFIFKGGVTWPVSCFQMAVTAGGTSGARDYYGADPTWFAGASFTRPLFDFGNTILGSGFAASGVHFTAGYVTFGDWLELAHHRSPPSSFGPMTVSAYGGSTSYIVLTNCVVRDWDMATPVASGTDSGGGWGYFGTAYTGVEATHCSFNQLSSATINGTALYGIPNVNYCEAQHCASTYHGGGVLHDNSFHDILDGNDPAQHQSAMQIYATSVIYNNLIHDFQSGRTAPIELSAPSGGSHDDDDRVYNNILYRVGWQGPMWTRPDSLNYVNYGLIAYSNVIEQTEMSVGPCIRVGWAPGAPVFGRLNVQSNILITPYALPVAYNNIPLGYDTVTTPTVTANTVYTSIADANAAGLTYANNYNPSGRAGPQGTVGAASYSPSPPTPPPAYGQLQLDSATVIVAEAGPNVTLRVTRTGGSFGVVSADYATDDGSAVAGHDYTTTTGTAYFASGSTNSVTVTVPIRNSGDTALTNRTFTVSLSNATGGATLGTPVSATVNIVMNPPTVPVVAYPTWSATNALVTPSVVVEADYITNSVWNTGLAQYGVPIPADGVYYLTTEVNAVDVGSNSWWVDFDRDPRFDDQRAWDVTTLTTGFATRVVGWRGTGTSTSPQFVTNTWTLSTGTHTLWIGGREPGAIKSFTANLVAPPPPPPFAFIQFQDAGLSSLTVTQTLVAVVNRTVNTAGVSTVHYATSDGTALAGRNYTATSGTLTFAAGVGVALIPITVWSDPVYRGNLAFYLTLDTPDVNSVISEPATLLITLAPSVPMQKALLKNAQLYNVEIP